MSPFVPLGGTMELSWTFAPGRLKNPSLFLLFFAFVCCCFVFLFFFSEKSYAEQLGSFQFLKEHSIEIE